MQHPLVTIIMPAYNAEKTISRAIGSVLKQDYSNIELIVVNDGSTDNTRSVCEQFSDARIKVITQENKGLSGARNTGLTNSKGEYVTFVDSDDLVEYNFISELLDGILKSKASLAICGMIREYSTYNQKVSFSSSTAYNDWKNNEAFLNLFEGGLINSCCNKLYITKQIIENYLSFSGKAIVEDIEFNLSYLQLCETVYTTKECLYHYMIGNESLTSKVSEDMLQNYMAIHAQFLNMLSNEYKSIAHKFVFHQYMSIFLRYLSKVNAKTMTRRDVYPIIRKYIKEPLIRQSFNSNSRVNYKEWVLSKCIQYSLFELILIYYKYNS